jgi:hypothetical protein
MMVAVRLMSSLFAIVVLGVYSMMSGAADRKEGARQIVARSASGVSQF